MRKPHTPVKSAKRAEEQERTVQSSISLRPSQWERLDVLADLTRWGRSGTVAEAVELLTELPVTVTQRLATLKRTTAASTLQERLRVNVRREGLERLGLPVGPWLNQAKAAVRSGAPDDTAIRIDGGATLALGLLKEAIFRVGKGQRIAYVTDAAGTADNAARIVALARDPDQLYIEAPFLEADRAIADARRHLTAHQAGLLARRAGARRLTTFHYSPRYEAEPDSLRREAEAAFRSDERC